MEDFSLKRKSKKIGSCRGWEITKTQLFSTPSACFRYFRLLLERGYEFLLCSTTATSGLLAFPLR